MAGADHWAASAEGRFQGGVGGDPLDPDRDSTATFRRFVGDLSLLAQCPDEPEATGPSLDDPWDASAADELVRLYASGEAGLAQPLSGDAELQLRLARTIAQADAIKPQCGADEGIEGRIDRLAANVEAALERVGAPSRADAGDLKIIEAHIGEILAQAQETHIELGRLAAIEAQLDEIKSSTSDGRIAGFVQAMIPTEAELTRFAETAAQKAIRAKPETAGDLSATARLNERAAEIQRALTRFIDEQRHNGEQVADALETMQQAMQYILDRIDAIEGAQAIAADVPSEDPEHGDAIGTYAPPLSAVDSVEDARIRAGLPAAGTPRHLVPAHEEGMTYGPGAPMHGGPAWQELAFDDHRFNVDGKPPELPVDSDATTARTKLAAEKAAYERDMRLAPPPPGRHGSGAKPVRGDGNQVLRPGILLAASLSAFLLAGYWLASSPPMRLPDGAATQTAEQHRPEKPSPAPAPELRSFSVGDDANVGSQKRAQAQSATGQTIEHGSSVSRSDRAEVPETQADLGRWAAPAAGAEALQGPIGVVVEQGGTAMAPEDMLRLRQRQRMANLSSRLGQQAAQPAQPIAFSTDGTGIASPAADGHRVSVELPPLMIGPHSLRHAAAKGDASAQFEVAARFAEGKGVEKDFEQAAIWYQRAAMQGFAAAQYRLAALYERGIGVAKDKARAKTWYRRAADQGNLKAMHNLAVLAAGNGEGTAPDYATAAHWFGEAAAHGLADSQYNLGILHENGLGVAKDATAAYKWYVLAARSGDKEAVRRRDLLEERLDAAVLSAVEAEVAAWQALPADRLANDARIAGQAWKRRTDDSAD